MSASFKYFWRRVYGVQKCYPDNQRAHDYAALLGVKTFSVDQIGRIGALGEQLEVVADPAAPQGWGLVEAGQ